MTFVIVQVVFLEFHSVIPCLFAHVPVVHTSVDGMGVHIAIQDKIGSEQIWDLKRFGANLKG